MSSVKVKIPFYKWYRKINSLFEYNIFTDDYYKKIVENDKNERKYTLEDTFYGRKREALLTHLDCMDCKESPKAVLMENTTRNELIIVNKSFLRILLLSKNIRPTIIKYEDRIFIDVHTTTMAYHIALPPMELAYIENSYASKILELVDFNKPGKYGLYHIYREKCYQYFGLYESKYCKDYALFLPIHHMKIPTLLTSDIIFNLVVVPTLRSDTYGRRNIIEFIPEFIGYDSDYSELYKILNDEMKAYGSTTNSFYIYKMLDHMEDRLISDDMQENLDFIVAMKNSGLSPMLTLISDVLNGVNINFVQTLMDGDDMHKIMEEYHKSLDWENCKDAYSDEYIMESSRKFMELKIRCPKTFIENYYEKYAYNDKLIPMLILLDDAEIEGYKRVKQNTDKFPRLKQEAKKTRQKYKLKYCERTDQIWFYKINHITCIEG